MNHSVTTSEKQLFLLYQKDSSNYEVLCFYSPCKTKYHFYNAELGEVVFDRETKDFISSTLPVTDDYKLRLKRGIYQWEHNFANFYEGL